MSNAAKNYSLEEMDRQSLIHPATSIADHLKNGPTIIAGGSGIRVKDRHGRELIDCGAGLWCVNVGYGRAELGEAAAQAMRDLGYYHTFASYSNEPIIRLADRLLRRVDMAESTRGRRQPGIDAGDRPPIGLVLAVGRPIR